jgi:hypothetical protein
MTRIAKALRHRHETNRARRALASAIANAGSPAMRDELLVIAQRASFPRM